MRMRMKKLLSILLVTAMLASMAVTAFADTNVTVPNGDIMVAALQDGNVTATLGEFTGSEGTYTATLTVTNKSTTDQAEITLGGTVKKDQTAVQDATVEFTGNDIADGKLTVSTTQNADSPTESTVTVTVTLGNTPEAGDYTVELTGVTVDPATITVAEATPPEETGEVTATMDGNFTAVAEAKNKFEGTVTLSNTYKADKEVTITGTVAAKAKTGSVTVDGSENGKVTVTPNGATAKVIVDLGADAADGDYTVTLNVAGTTDGTTTITKDVTVKNEVTPPAEGTVSVAMKTAFAVNPENPAQYNGAVEVTNGTNEAVTVTVAGTVDGATVTGGTTEEIAAGAKAEVPVVVTFENAPEAGSTHAYTLTFTGAEVENLTGTITVAGEVVEDTLSATVGSFTVNPENAAVYTGEVTVTNGTESPATVAVIGTVEGGTVTVNPESAEIAAGETQTYAATVTFSEAPADGTYTVTFNFGESGIEAKTATITVGTPVTPPDQGGNDNNGSSNSGSSSSGSSNSTPANAPSANVGSNGAVSAAKISGDAKKAVSNAKNGKANVNVTNAKTVGTAALNNMAKAAAKEDVALTMTAKTTDKNGVVVASLKFDATKAAEAVAKAGTKEVKLGVELNTKNTKNVTSLFKKWFKNKNVAAVKMAQKGEFGFTVEAAVKVDLKNFNKNNLKFYSYNAATNTYKEIETKYTIDAKGLVHFNTTVGNYVIITDAPIASK